MYWSKADFDAQSVVHVCFGIDRHGIIDFGFGHELADDLGFLIGQADDGNVVLAFFVQLVHVGDEASAGPAPGSPEIAEQDLALECRFPIDPVFYDELGCFSSAVVIGGVEILLDVKRPGGDGFDVTVRRRR